MSTPRIYFFLKTFIDPRHVELFLDGLLYMNSLDYFVKLEETDGAGRGDRYEGIVAWLQPNEIQLEINGIRISSADLAGPVSFQQNNQLTKNVLCIHASYIGGRAPSEFATTEEFERHLKIPKENISLGQHSIVVTNPQEFLNRVKTAAIEQNVSMHGRLVDYYDPSIFHGQFSNAEAPFKKHKRFAHQREYRIVIERREKDALPFALKIGSLRDIAHAVSIDDLNQGIKISPL